MRRNKKNHGDLVIDLTSLLDVIFIILLVVIGSGYQNNVNIEAKTDIYKEENKKLAEEKKLYKNAYDTQDFVCIIPISVPYDEEEVAQRKIVIPEELGFNNDDFVLIGASEDGYENFESKISSYIKENNKRPIILSLNENSDDILYRDEKRMNELLMNLSSEYDNVYIKGNVSEE